MACKNQYEDRKKIWCKWDGKQCPLKKSAEWKCLKLVQEEKERKSDYGKYDGKGIFNEIK